MEVNETLEQPFYLKDKGHGAAEVTEDSAAVGHDATELCEGFKYEAAQRKLVRKPAPEAPPPRRWPRDENDESRGKEERCRRARQHEYEQEILRLEARANQIGKLQGAFDAMHQESSP